MSEAAGRDFIVEGMLVLAGNDNCSLDDLLRKVAAALASGDGAQYAARGKRSQSFLKGEISTRRITLNHPDFTEATGYPDSWLSLAADRYGTGQSVIFVGIQIGHPGEQLDVEWKLGLSLMTRLVIELSPLFACMNGKLLDLERVILPHQEALQSSPLPLCFTPWTYFDLGELTADIKKRLALLPAPFTAPLARGWVVQALEKIDDPVRPEFLSALAELNDPPIRYIQPILEMR